MSISLSVLLHAALLGALVYGWMLFRRPPRPAPTLAIEARVVDARSVRGVQQPAPQPAPPVEAPPESVGPPQPTAEELAQREQQRAQEQAAAEEQQRQEAKEQAQREQELKRSLAAEEESSKARAGPALASWQTQIAAKINRNWLRPPTARPGIECMLNVTQVPGGEVTQVSIGECNGDQAVRESIEAAVYRASPLPPPPDPALFDRQLRIDFKPD